MSDRPEQRYTGGVNPDLSLMVADGEHMLPPGARTTFVVLLPLGTAALRRWTSLMRSLGHTVAVNTALVAEDYSREQS